MELPYLKTIYLKALNGYYNYENISIGSGNVLVPIWGILLSMKGSPYTHKGVSQLKPFFFSHLTLEEGVPMNSLSSSSNSYLYLGGGN